jgi:hypothetical protein
MGLAQAAGEALNPFYHTGAAGILLKALKGGFYAAERLSQRNFPGKMQSRI